MIAVSNKRNYKEKKVALVLVHWNTKQFIDKCLDSLLHQTYKNFDVYFIDNGSDDDGYEYTQRVWAPKFQDRIFFFKTGKNIGFAPGHNIGINAALEKGIYSAIGILNVDTHVDENWLKELKSTLDSGQKKKVGIATSNIVMYHPYKIFKVKTKQQTEIKEINGEVSYKTILFEANDGKFLNPKIISTPYKLSGGKEFYLAVPIKESKVSIEIITEGDPTVTEYKEQDYLIQNYGSVFDPRVLTYRDNLYLQPESEAEKETKDILACGCAMLFSTKALKELGPLDEDLFSYFEDVEISERYKTAGYKILMADKARVYHFFWGGTSSQKTEKELLAGQQFREYYGTRNRIAVIKKYKSKLLGTYVTLRQIGNILINAPVSIFSPEGRARLSGKVKGIWSSLSFFLKK